MSLTEVYLQLTTTLSLLVVTFELLTMQNFGQKHGD